MRIKLIKSTNRSALLELDDADLGLKYISNSRNLFDVIDKQLFFLMVIKYGITFEEIETFSVMDYYEIEEKTARCREKKMINRVCSVNS
jgi:hypothetical protein